VADSLYCHAESKKEKGEKRAWVAMECLACDNYGEEGETPRWGQLKWGGKKGEEGKEEQKREGGVRITDERSRKEHA